MGSDKFFKIEKKFANSLNLKSDILFLIRNYFPINKSYIVELHSIARYNKVSTKYMAVIKDYNFNVLGNNTKPFKTLKELYNYLVNHIKNSNEYKEYTISYDKIKSKNKKVINKMI